MLRNETGEGRGGRPRYFRDFELNEIGETLGVTKEHPFSIIFLQLKQNLLISFEWKKSKP